MRRILTLVWLNLLQVAKDRTSLVTLIGVPLMLTFLFGTVLGGGERKMTIAVADLDGTTISAELVAAFDPNSYDVRAVDAKTAAAMASSGEAMGGLIIPSGFEADVLGGIDTTVTFIEDPRSTGVLAAAQVLTGRAERISANASTVEIVRAAYRDAGSAAGAVFVPPAPDDIYAYADRLWSPVPPLAVTETVVTRSKSRATTELPAGFMQYSLGFTLMFMLFMGMGSAGGFLEEREQGTLSRLLMTPSGKVTLVAGKVLGIYVTVVFQAAIMIGFGVAVFGVPWGDDPLGVVMLIGSYALAATGLGVMISTLARTRGQVAALTAVGATAMSMLGGAYWPLDIVGPFMRTLALLTPTGWAMTGLTNVVVRAQGTSQAVLPTAVLLAMAGLFLVVGMARLKWE